MPFFFHWAQFDNLTLFSLVFFLFFGHGILRGKISAQPHSIVKQICFPNRKVLFLSLFFSTEELNA